MYISRWEADTENLSHLAKITQFVRGESGSKLRLTNSRAYVFWEMSLIVVTQLEG
jgi:hypothetical protein